MDNIWLVIIISGVLLLACHKNIINCYELWGYGRFIVMEIMIIEYHLMVSTLFVLILKIVMIIMCICNLYHSSILEWHKKLKPFLMENRDPVVLYLHYHCCWWPDNAWSQNISSHDVDLIVWNNPGHARWRLMLLSHLLWNGCHSVVLYMNIVSQLFYFSSLIPQLLMIVDGSE